MIYLCCLLLFAGGFSLGMLWGTRNGMAMAFAWLKRRYPEGYAAMVEAIKAKR